MTLSIANFNSVSDDRNNSEWYSSSNSKERWTSPIF